MNKKKYIKRIFCFLFLLLTMTIIFLFSAQSGNNSTQTSMSVTESFANTFFSTALSSQTIEIIETIIRKLAHFSEFAVLGIAACLFFGTYNLKRKKLIILSAVFCFLYSISDEVHQYFVPDRACRIYDVVIDTCGAISGILITVLTEQTLKKHIKRNN